MPFTEAEEYQVTLTFTTVITLAPMKRDTPVTVQDAIELAKDTLPEGVIAAFEYEGWDAKSEAHRLTR